MSLQGNIGGMRRDELIEIVEGAMGDDVVGGWWEAIRQGQAYADFQLSWEELEERVKQRPYAIIGGATINFEVARPVEVDEDTGHAVFVRNMGAPVSREEGIQIFSEEFGKYRKVRENKGEEKEKLKESRKGKKRRRGRKGKERRKRETNKNIQDFQSKMSSPSPTQIRRGWLPFVECTSTQRNKSKWHWQRQENFGYTEDLSRSEEMSHLKKEKGLEKREVIRDWEDTQKRHKEQHTVAQWRRALRSHYELSTLNITTEEATGGKQLNGEEEHAVGNGVAKERKCL